tara:strand:+ start:444 stop:1010 length:567 start_codon:yes stop_codon:yes gene_type:complete
MTRNLTTAVKNHLATNEIVPFHLLTIGFSTPVNLTDNSFTLTSSVSGSSKTYTASPFLVSNPSFTEETDLSKSSLNIDLSGADLTFISTALNENIVNDAVEIYRGFLGNTNQIITDPFLLYKGTIDTFAISESENESVLSLTVVSHWADFEKRSGRLTNNNSQQRFFSSDVGMNFSSQTVLDIKWGRK